MKATQRNIAPRTLARLDRDRRRYGITLAAVAAEAAKTSRRGTVGIPAVSNVLAGRYKSANVVATVKRLIAEAAVATPDPVNSASPDTRKQPPQVA